ncbi:MAG TPA: hypothetical protein VI911_08950 [Patescibacteria group bacterium]|nr:MAG: hypothetical protein UR43_C0005G0042 [candidate division TM6 bacterium GW2011_GWF2_33_332]HLD91125.1 hypothetical protein [Patescibacteria group bacterium]
MDTLNILNLEQLKNEMNSKEFAEKACNMLFEAKNYIDDLEEKVKHLEELLKNSSVPSIQPKQEEGILARRSHQMEIIEVEFKRMHDGIVMQGERLEGADLRKFDVLIKAYVALKNGDKLPKLSKEDKQEATADLLRIVSGEDDE